MTEGPQGGGFSAVGLAPVLLAVSHMVWCYSRL